MTRAGCSLKVNTATCTTVTTAIKTLHRIRTHWSSKRRRWNGTADSPRHAKRSPTPSTTNTILSPQTIIRPPPGIRRPCPPSHSHSYSPRPPRAPQRLGRSAWAWASRAPVTHAGLGSGALKVGGSVLSGMCTFGGLALSAATGRVVSAGAGKRDA